MMDSTWESRDLVVLEAAVKYLDENAGLAVLTRHALQELTGLPMEDVKKALVALEHAYLELQRVADGGAGTHWMVARVYPSARTTVGQWPSPETLADRLTQALAQAADEEPDEEKRGWLKKTAVFLGSAGRDIAVNVAATALTKSSGMG